MKTDVIVCGVGMVPFVKPGSGAVYEALGADAARMAISDAGITYRDIQQAYVGYVYGDSASGQAALYNVGLTGIPIVNVNNNCSTGSTALYLARQAILSGTADCVLAVGFEQMTPGAIGMIFQDRLSPAKRFDEVADRLVGQTELPMAIRYFGGAGKAHMERYGTSLAAFAKIRAKASRHASNNPLALFRKVVSPEEVLESPEIWPGVMTRLMACPPTCGGAAAVLVSEEFAISKGLKGGVRISAQSMTTDTESTFDSGNMMDLVGYGMTRDAANRVYEQAGIGPEDLDLVELHDCFAHNELITYEALGLCVEGGAEKFIEDGANTFGGKVVTNPSGGLLSKGHPLGATGLAQCYEITHQLRHTAGARQVEGARNALQHNLGIGGACVVTLYSKC